MKGGEINRQNPPLQGIPIDPPPSQGQNGSGGGGGSKMKYDGGTPPPPAREAVVSPPGLPSPQRGPEVRWNGACQCSGVMGKAQVKSSAMQEIPQVVRPGF